jgi:hypothetical protein
MEKVFIIVALLTGLNSAGTQDAMVFPEPTFTNSEECITYVRANKDRIFYQTWEYYGVRPIQNVYCVDEKMARDMLKPRPPLEKPLDETPPTLPLPKKEPDDIEEWWKITPSSNGLST